METRLNQPRETTKSEEAKSRMRPSKVARQKQTRRASRNQLKKTKKNRGGQERKSPINQGGEEVPAERVN